MSNEIQGLIGQKPQAIAPTFQPPPIPREISDALLKKMQDDELQTEVSIRNIRKRLETRKNQLYKVHVLLPTYDYGWIPYRALLNSESLDLTTDPAWVAMNKAANEKHPLTKEESTALFKLENRILGKIILEVDDTGTSKPIGESFLNEIDDPNFTNAMMNAVCATSGMTKDGIEALSNFFLAT